MQQYSRQPKPAELYSSPPSLPASNSHAGTTYSGSTSRRFNPSSVDRSPEILGSRFLPSTPLGSSNLPQMPPAPPNQNWAALSVHPESGEPRDQYDVQGFKRFICDICSKAFAQKSNMHTHRHTHTGETPHECKYRCGEYFGDPAKRTRHYNDPQSYCFQSRKAKE
ncbi:hypothetical protein K438DRAFT_1094504 [Mycena galopus ATCC 62051]|nr:hypothetical protein K438DRAFT_1094504 [Mycena galopus ATCC 62051]